MKLINFYEGTLDSLRKRMGAPLLQDLSLKAKKFDALTLEELEELTSGGLERSLSDCQIEDDLTLSFRGKRVVVYIHDRHMYGTDWQLPKFHIAYCKTLKNKQAENSYNQKYVITQRYDGLFSMRIFRNGIMESSFKKLDVCQNCLDVLSWDGFQSRRLEQSKRTDIVSNFTLGKFFEKYPKDVLTTAPLYNSDTVPINDYPENWKHIRNSLFDRRGYKCEDCGITTGTLEVHHVNGMRSNNTDVNLEILCHTCHQKHHSHYR